MKAHKYWSIGSLFCMIMCMYTGCNMRSKDAHKYWAMGALGCMLMAIYTGHKMIIPKSKKKAKEVEE